MSATEQWALNNIKELEQRLNELQEKYEEASALALLAASSIERLTKSIDDCKERFTHDRDCARRAPYRKDHWPCTCKAKAQGEAESIAKQRAKKVFI